MKVKHVSTHSNTVTNFPVTQQHRPSLTVTQNFHHSNKDLPWKLVPSCSLLADGPTSVILWVPFHSSIMFPDCQAALPMIAAISQPDYKSQISQIQLTNTTDIGLLYRVIIGLLYKRIGGLPNYSSFTGEVCPITAPITD